MQENENKFWNIYNQKDENYKFEIIAQVIKPSPSKRLGSNRVENTPNKFPKLFCPTPWRIFLNCLTFMRISRGLPF